MLLTFAVRSHGHRDEDQGNAPWPDFGDGDVGLNQFSSNGMTTTGLIEVDLNSPEPTPCKFIYVYKSYKVTNFICCKKERKKS